MKKEGQGNHVIIGIILTIITLFISFLLFYEYFFEHYYWYNRIKLYKMLKNKEISIISKNPLSINKDIIDIQLSNKAEMWYYIKENRVVYRNNESYGDCIGLFVSSPIMHWYNNQIIKMIK